MIVDPDIPDELVAWIKEQDSFPDDAFELGDVVVMYNYVDGEGANNWNYHVRGSNLVSRIVSLMEMCKFRMMSRFIAEGLGEVDDQSE